MNEVSSESETASYENHHVTDENSALELGKPSPKTSLSHNTVEEQTKMKTITEQVSSEIETASSENHHVTDENSALELGKPAPKTSPSHNTVGEQTKMKTISEQNQRSGHFTSSNVSFKFVSFVLESDLNSIIDQNSLPLVTVKFCIDEERFATAFKPSARIADINKSLLDVLELEEDVLKLTLDGSDIKRSSTLSGLGAKPFDKIMFNIEPHVEYEGTAMIVKKIRENIPTLRVITVHQGETGDGRDIVVEIENQCCAKEWLGGYHNRKTNIDYHNAETQTLPKPKVVNHYTKSGEKIPLYYHRDTQTPFKPKSVMVDTHNDKDTQTYRADLLLTKRTDRIMTPGNYITHDEWYSKNNHLRELLVIQRAVKSWIHTRKIHKILSMEKQIREEYLRQKLQILKEQADKEREIITGAAFPVKRQDFYMLYLVVGNWWKQEWKRICSTRFGESKKTESYALLIREIKLLEEIEKLRIVGKREALKKEKIRFLQQISRPVTFKNSKGQMTCIDNLATQKAGELRETYVALIEKNITPKDRIETLFTFKQLFTSHYMSYEYSNDLISLIDREINLLTMGIKLEDLRGLQKRIEQLYMNFLEQKEFNPQAAKYKMINVPKTITTRFQCGRCLKVLPASKFPVHVRMKRYNECTSCTWMQNIGHQRSDLTPFGKLLKAVQNSEMEKCCHSAVCFILQPIGMGYLTNVIWHGHSAISECKDLSKLQHVRWIKNVDWAPWNTVLLTDQEAKCHNGIQNVFEFYGDSFIEKVKQRHISARKALIPLLQMNHDITTSGVWSNVRDDGVFLHPSHGELFATQHDYDKM